MRSPTWPGPRLLPCDILYIAPPQYQGLWLKALRMVDARPELLTAGGLAIVQIFPKEWAEPELENLILTDERRYGSTALYFFAREIGDVVSVSLGRARVREKCLNMSLPVARTAAGWRPWFLASRPKTLPAAVTPVLVGTALAIKDGVFAPGAALVALCSALLIQVGANFANDLYDFKRGADPETRLGPTRVTSAGMLSPQAVERGMWVVFALAALGGVYLVYCGGWPILVAGLASIIAAIAYTAGPFPLGYNGLGDLFVFVFFGLVGVMGTYYVQAHQLGLQALLASVPAGVLVTNILVVNNVRDVDTDRATGKRTLAVIFGVRAAQAEYLVMLALAYATPFVFWLGRGSSAWVLLPLITLPLGVRLVRAVLFVRGPALNRTLAGTAQFAALYGLLFAFGLIL